MNKALVINLLNAYAVINDGCLTIVTDNKVFNHCRVSDLDLNLVYIRDKDNELSRIEIDDIIGIQFQDEATLVGMKLNSKDMFNQKEYNKCANFEIILGVISMIGMTIILVVL